MHYGETCDTRKTNGEPGVKPHLSPYLPVFQPKKEKGESVKAKTGKHLPNSRLLHCQHRFQRL